LTLDASHLLVFQVKDVEPLYAQFGTAAVRVGLADLAPDAETALRAVIAGHGLRTLLQPSFPCRPDRWWDMRR
jgi:hypothetical protein